MEHIYYTNSDATVCTNNNILCYTLKRALSDDVVQESYSVALGVAKKNEICNWIFEVIGQAAINEEAFLNLCIRFLPLLVPYKTKQNCLAFVLEPGCFNELLLTNGNNKAIIHNSIFHIRIFTCKNEAAEWLKNMQK